MSTLSARDAPSKPSKTARFSSDRGRVQGLQKRHRQRRIGPMPRLRLVPWPLGVRGVHTPRTRSPPHGCEATPGSCPFALFKVRRFQAVHVHVRAPVVSAAPGHGLNRRMSSARSTGAMPMRCARSTFGSKSTPDDQTSGSRSGPSTKSPRRPRLRASARTRPALLGASACHRGCKALTEWGQRPSLGWERPCP